jgi:hypothetical protein
MALLHIKWRSLRRSHPFRSYRVPQRRSRGQAIVELTLALTFLAYLFAAAVDLGLAYKSYQTLINATAEASGSLKVAPLVACGIGCDPIPQADERARVRFRGEQGDQLKGTASTLDLNSKNGDDRTEFTTDTAWMNFITTWVQIDEADQSQVTTTNSDFAVDNTFTPSATVAECQRRESVYFDADGNLRQCFLVVRTRIIYRPFAIAPAVGDEMTIRALSVVPIVR